MNPIRSLAPCIVNHSFPEYLWIYFVGPIAGVTLAVLVYKLVKALEYETAQDQEPSPELVLPLANVRQRKPSSVIPIASVSRPPSLQGNSPPHTPELHIQPASKPQTKASFSQGRPPGQEAKAALPECYAD
jgi:aquaporin rerated protein, other eukaryote